MTKNSYRRRLLLCATAAIAACCFIAVVNAATIVEVRDGVTVELMSDPVGIDTVAPSFSWKIDSKRNGTVQVARRIVVHEAAGGDVVWDSGKVEDDEQTFIPYAGKPLKPKTDYRVTVELWLNNVERQSMDATFSTGIFPTAADPHPWKGKWIGSEAVPENKATVELTGASWIAWKGTTALDAGKSVYRRAFELDARAIPRLACVAFAGDNSHTLYVNGVRVNAGGSFKQAGEIAITNRLVPGRNVVAVEANNAGDAPNPGGIVGGIALVDARGKVTRYLTDTNWKAAKGSDAAWFAPGFDDSKWANAQIVAAVGKGPWGDVTVTTSDDRVLPARYLSKVVELGSKPIRRAVVYVIGLGYYELRLDGDKVGDHLLDPVLTDPTKRVPYNTYDVTQQLKRKEAGKPLNISVVLGNGRFYAPRKGVTYGTPRLLFQMEIEFADGSVQTVVSDAQWKISVDGPIVANNDYDGETYLSSREIPPDPGMYLERGWGKRFSVATTKPVEIVAAPQGVPVAQMMPSMRRGVAIAPKTLKQVRPGVWIYDFGQNFVGWARIMVKGPAGTKVQLRFAESLLTDGPDKGTLYTANLRSAKCRDIYELSGNKNGEAYEPRFTCHGFRYAELTGFPGTPTLATLTGYTVSTALPLVGSFKCDHEIVNRIVSNVEWGTRGNYLSIPTDCPQRDERQGWQGDRAAESRGEMYLFDNITLYRKWLQDIEDTQRPDGNVSDVAPAYWLCYNPNVTWPSAQTIVPESLYLMYGDTKAIAAHYASRYKWLDFLATFTKPDGTIDKDNYGDWCVPPESQELIHSKDPACQTSKALLATSYYIYNLRLSAKFAKILGKTDDAAVFTKKADLMTDVFNRVFYNAQEGKYDNGTQTSCALPLAFGLVPEKEKARVARTLVNNIENVTHGHVGTGLIGGQWINRVLTDLGRIDLVWGFATKTDYPSWGYMVRKGATTVWELWNGDTADPAMNSGNHVMLVGDLVIWLFEDVAGIAPDENAPGFKRIIMRPTPVGDLKTASASYKSIRGTIKSSWKLDGDKFDWCVVVPANTTALASVPTVKVDSIRCAGLDLAKAKPVRKGNRVEMALPSGTWRIVADYAK